jgi:hypothetical protein
MTTLNLECLSKEEEKTMKNKKIWLGILIMILVFGVIFWSYKKDLGRSSGTTEPMILTRNEMNVLGKGVPNLLILLKDDTLTSQFPDTLDIAVTASADSRSRANSLDWRNQATKYLMDFLTDSAEGDKNIKPGNVIWAREITKVDDLDEVRVPK